MTVAQKHQIVPLDEPIVSQKAQTVSPAPIAAPLFELAGAVRPLEETKPRDCRPALEITSGSCTVKIFTGPRGKGPFTIAWREGAQGRRQRLMRSDLAAAKRKAAEIATRLAQGDAAMLGFTGADQARWLAFLERCQRLGKTPEAVVAEAEALAREAASRAKIVDKPCPEIVAELLASLRQDGAGSKWLRTLESQLTRFAGHFQCPLPVIRAPDLNAWLRSLGVGTHTRKNYRGAVLQLINFAKARGYLPADWSEMQRVEAPEVRDAEIRILTPDQLVRLLACTADNMLPFTVIAAFAGIRHEEMNGEKATLDWRDFHWKEKLIYVPSGVGKTKTDRLVPMADNLIAWLKPFARSNGPVVSLVKTSAAICRAKARAGIPAGKNQTRNTLRKSFISYRLALVKNIAQVAEEAGNSPAKIKSNYRRPVPETEARRWFEIYPTTAGVLQLDFKMALP